MEAKEAINAIIGELEDQETMEVSIASAIHSRIIGYEQNCMEAKEAINAIIGELEDQETMEVSIASAIHSRIIGQKGRTVRKIMETFKTDIRFPKNPDDPDLVLVTGTKENCENCIEHLLVLEEEHMEEVYARNDERDIEASYTK